MSRFVERQTTRVDLGGDDWVEVRARLQFGDRRLIEERLYGLTRKSDGRINVYEERPLNLLEANVELLRLSIVAWGGPGFCVEDAHPHVNECISRPITAENIKALDETGERILGLLPSVQQSRGTPDFTRPSSPESSTGEAEAPTPPDASSSSSSWSDSPGPTTS